MKLLGLKITCKGSQYDQWARPTGVEETVIDIGETEMTPKLLANVLRAVADEIDPPFGPLTQLVSAPRNA